jgi:uncharacterized membrane protein YciS (DUF1049 family)
MLDINVKQNRKITLLATLIGGIGGLLAIAWYIQRLKHGRDDKKLKELEREIKLLQLKTLKEQNGYS